MQRAFIRGTPQTAKKNRALMRLGGAKKKA
jgi:hypothetical protein